MAYNHWNEMIFGTSVKPVTTKSGLVIGGGFVVPEVVPHPRPGSEKELNTLLREFERANEDTLERSVSIGFPALVIENEHVFQMTNNPNWGMEIAAQTARQIADYNKQYGITSAYRSTIADIRKPTMVHMRDSDRAKLVLESFEACATYADILSIESIGGKEIFDYSIMRNDITGLLFATVLRGLDSEWLWTHIVDIAQKHDCIAGGDTNCSQANTAMFMAGGFKSNDIPHSLAVLCRAMGVSSALVPYECGAVGPAKDCGYENPIIKAITGIPISTEGKSSACAHLSLVGNIMAATCDLWANEAIQYGDMFGGSTSAVFTEILGYDAALMNSSIQLENQKELQANFINSDRYRSPHGFILCPDNAYEIGQTVVENNESLYARAKAAAQKCGELLINNSDLILTNFENESLISYLKEIELLPEKEDDFIDLCLKKYSKVKGFKPESYGL